MFTSRNLKYIDSNKIITSSQTWNLSKILHRRIFRLKILLRQFHLILTFLVRKNTKNEWKWRNSHHWQKFYTAAGTDGMEKFHLWVSSPIQARGLTKTWFESTCCLWSLSKHSCFLVIQKKHRMWQFMQKCWVTFAPPVMILACILLTSFRQ